MRISFVLAAAFVLAAPLHAWDHPGHRMVNQLALAALPKEFPAFVHEPANAERIAYLSGEADRWRAVPDLYMPHSGGSWTDHFLDLEYIPMAGMEIAKLPSFRYDFVVQYAAGRAAHLHNFEPIDPARNADHTREWPGFAPWAITEGFGRLRAAFATLKTFEEQNLGTPEELANAQATIVHLMGFMGHYVGDCAQPLHTTLHHNGWAGENPKGYTTWRGFHSWVDGKDGGIFEKAGIQLEPILARVRTAEPISLADRADARDPMFVAAVDYLVRQHAHVEPLYQLEKTGKLGNAPDAKGVADEGRAFIEARLLDGGQMLAAIWLTAWRGATPSTYLRSQLLRRQMGNAPAPAAAGPKKAP
jgi:hypothetical protein